MIQNNIGKTEKYNSPWKKKLNEVTNKNNELLWKYTEKAELWEVSERDEKTGKEKFHLPEIELLKPPKSSVNISDDYSEEPTGALIEKRAIELRKVKFSEENPLLKKTIEKEIEILQEEEQDIFGKKPPFPFEPISITDVAKLYQMNYEKLRYALKGKNGKRGRYEEFIYEMKWRNRVIHCVDNNTIVDLLEMIKKRWNNETPLKKWRKFLMEEKHYKKSNPYQFMNRKKGKVVPTDYFEKNPPSEKAFKALKKGKNLL